MGAINVSVRVGSDGLERALRKFQNKMEDEGILKSIQRHEFYLTKSQRVKSARRMARRKNQEKLAKEKE